MAGATNNGPDVPARLNPTNGKIKWGRTSTYNTPNDPFDFDGNLRATLSNHRPSPQRRGSQASWCTAKPHGLPTLNNVCSTGCVKQAPSFIRGKAQYGFDTTRNWTPGSTPKTGRPLQTTNPPGRAGGTLPRPATAPRKTKAPSPDKHKLAIAFRGKQLVAPAPYNPQLGVPVLPSPRKAATTTVKTLRLPPRSRRTSSTRRQTVSGRADAPFGAGGTRTKRIASAGAAIRRSIRPNLRDQQKKRSFPALADYPGTTGACCGPAGRPGFLPRPCSTARSSPALTPRTASNGVWGKRQQLRHRNRNAPAIT